MTELFIIIGLILLNGFFSMAEIALISSRKTRLESQANKGDKRAAEALKLVNRPESFLSTVQIGITLIGILLGIFSGDRIQASVVTFFNQFELLRSHSNGIATAFVVVIITYFSLVIGELVPKRIGLSNPERIAKAIAAPMRFVSWITHPFVVMLGVSCNALVKLFHLKASDNHVTEEEIKAIINEGTEQGAIEEAEQEIIERVFHLGDRNITSLMTHRNDIIWFDIHHTTDNVKEGTRENTYSIYPICDNDIDEIKGIVLLKDIFRAAQGSKLIDLVQPAFYVPENISAYQILEKFKEKNVHHAFIVDEYGTLQGLVTLNDIMEAIVGDISSENKTDDYEIVAREDGSYLIDGQLPFYDFLAYIDKADWNESESEFDTIAGFMLYHLEHIPTVGEKIKWRGFCFEIVDMDSHRIDKILVMQS